MHNREIKIAYIVATIAAAASFIYGILAYEASETREHAQERQMLNAVFTQKLESLGKTAFDYSYWTDTIDYALIDLNEEWADQNIGTYLIETFNVSLSILFNQNNQVVMGFGGHSAALIEALQNTPTFVEARNKTIAKPVEEPGPENFFFRDNNRLYLGAVSAVTREEVTGKRLSIERSYLVLLQEVSVEMLQQIAEDYSFDKLGFRGDRDFVHVQVETKNGLLGPQLYYMDEHNFINQFGWTILPFGITFFSFLYLLTLIHNKTRQTLRLNEDLALANAELSTFNKKLTEQVERQTQEIVEKARKAEEANKAKSAFLSSMSHELRTPLNGILGFAQMMRLNRDQNLTEKQTAWIDQIVDSGNLLLDIINDVLDLARIESGRSTYESETFQPRVVFKECFDIVKPLAEKRNISLSGMPETNQYVHVDRAKLKQVILNLIGNAIKYGHDDGYVKFGCRDAGEGKIELYVKDNGRGIPEADLPLIFEPFHRVPDASLLVEGTGVGLAVVKKNLELMNGHIIVESELGKGSCFKFYLDAYPAPDALEA